MVSRYIITTTNQAAYMRTKQYLERHNILYVRYGHAFFVAPIIDEAERERLEKWLKKWSAKDREHMDIYLANRLYP